MGAKLNVVDRFDEYKAAQRTGVSLAECAGWVTTENDFYRELENELEKAGVCGRELPLLAAYFTILAKVVFSEE